MCINRIAVNETQRTKINSNKDNCQIAENAFGCHNLFATIRMLSARIGINNQSTALLCVISRLSVIESAEIRLASNELVMHNAFRLFRFPARSKMI